MATVVVIPGSFAPPSMYDSLVESLSRSGIQSEVVDIPSVGRRQDKAPATMIDDVKEIVSVVERLLEQDREVAILTHSYGGVPGTQSLEKLSCKARQAEGKKGGVGKIIYMSAVVLPVGGSVLALLEAPEFLKIEVRHQPMMALSALTFLTGRLHDAGTRMRAICLLGPHTCGGLEASKSDASAFNSGLQGSVDLCRL